MSPERGGTESCRPASGDEPANGPAGRPTGRLGGPVGRAVAMPRCASRDAGASSIPSSPKRLTRYSRLIPWGLGASSSPREGGPSPPGVSARRGVHHAGGLVSRPRNGYEPRAAPAWGHLGAAVGARGGLPSDDLWATRGELMVAPTDPDGSPGPRHVCGRILMATSRRLPGPRSSPAGVVLPGHFDAPS